MPRRMLMIVKCDVVRRNYRGNGTCTAQRAAKDSSCIIVIAALLTMNQERTMSSVSMRLRDTAAKPDGGSSEVTTQRAAFPFLRRLSLTWRYGQRYTGYGEIG